MVAGSLRSRQLVSGFTIIVIGIMILGVLLSFSIYTSKTTAIKEEMENLTQDLMGYVVYEDNGFVVSKHDEEEFNKKLRERLGADPFHGFVYIWDIERDKIIWDSIDNREPEEGKSTPRIEHDPLISSRLTDLEPVKTEILDAKQTPTNQQAQRYMVSANQFNFRPPDSGDDIEFSSYLFVVGKTMSAISQEIESLVQIFAILFFLSVILILIAQLASSFWVVAPIREFEGEVREIEQGRQEFIQNTYVEELTPIKNTINALIGFEKGQKQRYKDSLDDLAHSLKTPLAAIQSQLEGDHFSDMPRDHPGLSGIASEIEYMQEIISRQLRKAMVTSDSAIIMAQPIKPILLRLANTLKKVHRGKEFEIRLNVDEYAKCRLDVEDLMELFGNLLNNACRFCDQVVEVSATRENDMLIVDIDDDGMGFPSENPSSLLKRGIRVDSQTEGQGIGLAVSTEIVSAVNGKIELLMSPYVGARVRLHLPC